MQRCVAILSLLPLAVLWCCLGCVSPAGKLDPEVRWRQAERRLGAVTSCMEDIRLLRNEYEAVILLGRSGELRGRAFLRLAELDLAQNDHGSAREHIEQALRAGLEPGNQGRALLLLGDLLERKLKRRGEAQSVYQQLIHEHPGSDEAELAELRVELLKR